MFDKPSMITGDPPKGGSSVTKPCSHDYVFLDSDYQRLQGTYKDNWKQIDRFYCRAKMNETGPVGTRGRVGVGQILEGQGLGDRRPPFCE